jgi:hypothetical protein
VKVAKKGVHQECESCYKSQKKTHNGMSIRKLSKENDCDPFPQGHDPFLQAGIPPLHEMEKQLIVTAQSHMKCYILPGNGDVAYAGNVINVEQDVTTFITQLPPMVENMPHIYVRKETGGGTDQMPNCKDFKVCRNVVLLALQVLKQTNPREYGEVEIHMASLESLPENGSVFDRIPQMEQEAFDQMLSQQQHAPAQPNAAAAPVPAQEEEEAQQQELGPEQGGATGEHPEDATTDQLQNEYIGQPIQPTGTVENALNTFLGTTKNPVAWPIQGELLSDYNTPFLQSRCFPHLFPYGTGDATNPDRLEAVSLTDMTHHLLWYSFEREDGSFYYPFASDQRWQYWAQNTCGRETSFPNAKRSILG